MNTKKLCVACKSMKFDQPVRLSTDMPPVWLRKTNYVHNFIKGEKEFKVKRQKDNVMQVTLQLSPEDAGLYVLYWAATPNDNNLKTKHAKDAYDKFQNSGIGRVQMDGTLNMYIQCPQNYKTVDDNSETYTFYRHVHYILQKRSVKEWDMSWIWTLAVTCRFTVDYFRSILLDKSFLVVNALGPEYDIPGAIHLDPRKRINTLKRQLVRDLQEHPMIKHAVETNQIDWYAIPIVIYCKNAACHASENLAVDLYRKGFVNVSIFPAGYDKIKKSKLI